MKKAQKWMVATGAGLVLVALGRIPATAGDRVELASWTIEVTAVGHNAITEVRLIRHTPAVGTEDPDASP